MAVTGDGLVDRELSEAREREADYRARLARHRDLAQRLRAHAAFLRDSLRNLAPGALRIERLLEDVARVCSEALQTPRTSVWLFDEARQHLVCRFHVSGNVRAVEDGLRLSTHECPAYVNALFEARQGAVAVDDARNDPRTRELAPYLRQFEVGALLDIPILGPGVVHGVVCLEHQGGPRLWQEEEIDFAMDVGALVALVLEAERRISAERLARGTEARYQHLVESLPVTVYSFDARTGSLAYLSPQVVQLGGRAAEEYLVSHGVDRWLEAIEPEDRFLVQQRLSGSIDEGFAAEIEYRIRLPNGERRFVRDTCAVVRDARGLPIAVQGTLADVTELKKIEAERFEAERRYRSLLENIELPAAILDVSGRVELVNDALVRLTGFSRQEALGADGFDLVLPPEVRERAKADFAIALQKRKIAPHFESALKTRAGAVRRVVWTNTLMLGADGMAKGLCSLGIDITDRVLAHTVELEHQKLESLGRLAAGVAHDFNNLLTVIAGAAAQVRRLAGGDEAFREIRGAVEQASGLTRSLLAYARREPIAPKLIAPDDVIEATLPMLRRLVPPPLRLSHRLGTSGTRIVVDETQLRQVLMNLVGNAAEVTSGTGTEVRVTSDLVLLEPDQAKARGLIAEGTFVVISIADDGPGVPEEYLQRIFDPFVTSKPAGQGTGLGLSLCASIAQRAGGFIAVDSVPGRGATFRVHFPVAVGAGSTSSAGASNEPGNRPPFSTTGADRVVLLLEDNEPIRNLVARVLSAHGIGVLEAADIASARALLAETRVDLLITDANLPDGDARAWALSVATGAQAPKVLLMSGSGPQDEYVGFDAVVAKPFNVDALVETVLGLVPADAVSESN